MNYILGNTLGGAGALNADRLALNLQFAADKSLKPRRGPTPTFSRASAATNVGPNGLIGYSENLAFFSQQFNNYNTSGNIVYEGSDLSIAPDGTLTADRIRFTGGTTGSLLRSSSGAFTGSKVITLWVKHVPTSDVIGAEFRLQFGNAVSSNFTATTQWQRFEFVTTDNASSFLGIVAPSTGSTQTFDIWGIQYQRGTFSTEYLPTTSAAVYGPRFDHDPITLACRGLLIEEQRTNNVLRSEEFDSASWGNGTVTRTANQLASPDGATTADLITSVANNFGGKLAQNFTFATTTYTASIYVKKGNWRYVGIQLADVSSSSVIPTFDFDTETVSQNGTSFSTLAVQKLANGWYRLSLTQSTTAISSTFAVWLTASNGNVTGPIGAGNTLYAWGAQLEAGSFPTSYIPTTTATVARSADVCSITGSNFTSSNFYNPSEGTIIVIGSLNTTNTNSAPEGFKFNDGTTNNRIQIGMTNVSSEAVRPFIVASGTLTYNSTTGTATIGVQRKIGTAYNTNDAISAFNGVLGTQDTTVTMPTGINQALIGVSTFVGTIASIKYFKKRLPNAKLQSLTT